MANNIINIERMMTSVSLGADSQYVLAEMQWAGEEKSRLPITYLPFKDHLTAGIASRRSTASSTPAAGAD